jgi:hypothetical protein
MDPGTCSEVDACYNAIEIFLKDSKHKFLGGSVHVFDLNRLI